METQSGDNVQWYLKPLGVLLLLFVVLGPLALPLLYRSPGFSRHQKIVLTAVVLVYTAYLLFESVEFAMEIIRTLDEFATHDLGAPVL